MKRTIIMLAALASLLPTKAANIVVNNPDNHAFWGVRATFDYSVSTMVNYTNAAYSFRPLKAAPGFQLGAIYNLPLVANLYLEPGVNFFYDTHKENIYVGTSITSSQADLSYSRYGVRVPVMVGYHFDVWENASLKVFTGPEVSYGIGSSTSISYDGNKADIIGFKPDFYDRVKRFECSWDFGAGITFSNIDISVAGSLGLLNANTAESSLDYKINRIYVAVGYNF